MWLHVTPALYLPVRLTTMNPEIQIPAEKRILALNRSTRRPPRNLLMAYARFWLLVINPERHAAMFYRMLSILKDAQTSIHSIFLKYY